MALTTLLMLRHHQNAQDLSSLVSRQQQQHDLSLSLSLSLSRVTSWFQDRYIC